MSDDGTIESLSRSSSNSSVASVDSEDREYEVCTKANGIRIQSHAQDSFLLRKHLCNINTCAGLKIDEIEGVSGYKEVVPGNILLGRKLGSGTYGDCFLIKQPSVSSALPEQHNLLHPWIACKVFVQDWDASMDKEEVLKEVRYWQQNISHELTISRIFSDCKYLVTLHGTPSSVGSWMAPSGVLFTSEAFTCNLHQLNRWVSDNLIYVSVYWSAMVYPMWHIAQALAHMHRHQCCHLDVKPGNVLLRWNPHSDVVDTTPGHMRQFQGALCDFSISRVFVNCSSSHSPGNYDSGVVGVITTPELTPPECLVGQCSQSFKTDVWQFGELLSSCFYPDYPCVTSQLRKMKTKTGNSCYHRVMEHVWKSRFSPRPESVFDWKHPKNPFAIALTRAQGIDPAFAELMQMCLTANPDERPTMDQVLKHRAFDGCRIDAE